MHLTCVKQYAMTDSHNLDTAAVADKHQCALCDSRPSCLALGSLSATVLSSMSLLHRKKKTRQPGEEGKEAEEEDNKKEEAACIYACVPFAGVALQLPL